MKKFLLILFLAIFLGQGYVAVHASAPMTLRVGLLDRFNNRSSIVINNTAIIYHSHGESVLYQSSQGFTVRPYGGRYLALYDGSGRIRVSDSILIHDGSNTGMITLDGVVYRGGVDFMRLGGSGVTAVNVVSIEEYLFSVVPSEMPASWHPEALKAQAVAARTFALHSLSRGSRHTGFDLCSLTCCQVYRGIEREHEATTQAVLATAGLAIYFNGQLIEAVYSASSGGMTENSENVWVEARPYLRSVPDIHEFEPVIWARSFTLTELTNLLAQNNRAIGSATGISIGSTHPSGRVESLIIHGTGGQVVLTREEIRTFFASSAEGSLMSRNFTIGGGGQQPQASVAVFDGNQIINIPLYGSYVITVSGITKYQGIQAPAPVLTGDIVITGRGFGHGVGMSQRGAEGMARRGYTFREILTHFYTGVTIN